MKKNMMKIGIALSLAVLTTLSLFSCNSTTHEESNKTNKPKVSEKGAWTDAEKEKALDELNTKRSEMEAMIGAEYTEKMYDCTMEKIQAQYDNFRQADSDYAGMRQIGADCMIELLESSNSTKGNWNEMDLTRARFELSKEREQLDALIGTEQTDLFIECAIEEIQNKYKNFREADSDIAGMEKIGEQCMLDLLK